MDLGQIVWNLFYSSTRLDYSHSPGLYTAQSSCLVRKRSPKQKLTKVMAFVQVVSRNSTSTCFVQEFCYSTWAMVSCVHAHDFMYPEQWSMYPWFLQGSVFISDEQRRVKTIKPKPSGFYLINSVTRPWRKVGAIGQSNNLFLPQLACEIERWTTQARFLLSWSSHLIVTSTHWVLIMLCTLYALSHFLC